MSLSSMSIHTSTLTASLAERIATFREGGVDVDVDLTIVGQIVLFFVLLLILKPLLFNPMLQLFKEREKRIDGAKAQARHNDVEAANVESKYTAEMAFANAEGAKKYEALRLEGVKRETEILSAVRATSGKTIEDGRKRIDGDMATARKALDAEANQLARAVASQVLGREIV